MINGPRHKFTPRKKRNKRDTGNEAERAKRSKANVAAPWSQGQTKWKRKKPGLCCGGLSNFGWRLVCVQGQQLGDGIVSLVDYLTHVTG